MVEKCNMIWLSGEGKAILFLIWGYGGKKDVV